VGREMGWLLVTLDKPPGSQPAEELAAMVRAEPGAHRGNLQFAKTPFALQSSQ